MYLKRGQLLTSRKFCFSFLSIANMRAIEWFRPPNDSDLSTSYGRYKGTYALQSTFVLLNLGCEVDRQLILNCTSLERDDLNPDMQYSCHDANLKVHVAIYDSPLLKRFDGTIISKLHTDPSLSEDLAGPEEVVIFMRRVQNRLLLSHVQDDSNDEV
jgi:hypothetical protein